MDDLPTDPTEVALYVRAGLEKIARGEGRAPRDHTHDETRIPRRDSTSTTRRSSLTHPTKSTQVLGRGRHCSRCTLHSFHPRDSRPMARRMVPLRKLSGRSLPEPAPRMARLRPEFSSGYPEIPPGVWVTAFSASWVVVYGVLAHGRPWPGCGSRVLRDEHFEFHAGSPRPPGWRGEGSRSDDP